MKNILVLTDFSIRAGYAAEYAMHLAIKNEADIILCHAIEPPSGYANEGELNWAATDTLLSDADNAKIDIKHLGNKLLKLTTAGGQSFKPGIIYLVEFGTLCQVAKKIIGQNGVDMVVIGSHHSSVLTRLLSGSHIYNLIDELKCPVLLVPESARYKGIKTIAYATDLTFNNNKVIKYLINIARPFNATVSVNHVFTDDFLQARPEQAKHAAIPNMDELGYNAVTYQNLKSENVKEGLFELIGSGQVDILTTVHKRYDFFERLFHKSISKLIADSSQIPVLILPYLFSKTVESWTDEQLDEFCFKAKGR